MLHPNLSEDCFLKIVEYVPLYDLLTFASTSLLSMTNILPELRRRRGNISQNHAWEQSKLKLLSVSQDDKERPDQRHFIPSVLARLKCLFRSLNVDHPQRSCIYQLIQNIENYDDIGFDEDIMSDETRSFEKSFAALQELLNAHKLHSIVLRNAMYTKPSEIDGENKTYWRVLLYKYIGDMQITYFCLGHSVIIEGVSESKWVRNISEILDECEGTHQVGSLTSADWYQLYQFFHSSYLRNCSLSPKCMVKLGLANESMVEFITRGKLDQQKCLLPHRPFQSLMKMDVMNRIELCKHHCSVFSSIYEFGPLGPGFQFRGRDRVRQHSFTEMNEDGEPLRCLMHSCIESKKVNPMNVSLPLMTFDCMYH